MGGNKMTYTPKKKILIIIGIFLMFIVLTSAIYISLNRSNTNKDPTKDPSYTITYVDPGSGETVITTPNQGPELSGRTNNITYLGFAKLLNAGVSDDQIDTIKSDIYDYSSTQRTPIKEISITVVSIRQTVEPSTGNVTLRFTLTIDRTSTLVAQVGYFGIGVPTLKLYDSKTNKLIFTSK